MSLGSLSLVSSKNFLMWLGILPVLEEDFPSSLKEYRLKFNFLHISILKIWLICYFFSVLSFLIFVANSFQQYTESGLFFTLSILRITVYFIMVSKRMEISMITEEIENLVDISMFIKCLKKK